jgi:hypothetical protein
MIFLYLYEYIILLFYCSGDKFSKASIRQFDSETLQSHSPPPLYRPATVVSLAETTAGVHNLYYILYTINHYIKTV